MNMGIEDEIERQNKMRERKNDKWEVNVFPFIVGGGVVVVDVFRRSADNRRQEIECPNKDSL